MQVEELENKIEKFRELSKNFPGKGLFLYTQVIFRFEVTKTVSTILLHNNKKARKSQLFAKSWLEV